MFRAENAILAEDKAAPASTPLPESFKLKISQEIKEIDDNSPENRKTCANYKRLEKANSVEDIIPILQDLGHPAHIGVTAKSRAMHDVVAANPDVFINFFSRDNMRALIHEVCLSGNAALAIILIEKLKLNVTTEKVASPFYSYTNYEDGRYEFHDAIPVIHAAAKSGSLDLVKYLASFYDLSKLDRKARHGHLQGALVHAASKNAYDVTAYLLSLGVSPDSALEEDEYKVTYSTALFHANWSSSQEVVRLLVDNHATIQDIHLENAIRSGNVERLKFYLSRGKQLRTGGFNNERYFKDAVSSGSVSLVRYLVEDLKLDLYGEWTNKTYYHDELLKEALDRGSIAMLEYMENELKIPVYSRIRTELDSDEVNYRCFEMNHMVKEAVCSYNVRLLKYLFEEKGLMPSRAKLQQLEGYAYDCGKCLPQHQKFRTHAYVYSFLHGNPEMQKLLYRISETEDLHSLSAGELFMLYADYTKNFREDSRRFQYGRHFRDNSIHLANEIARRKLGITELLDLAAQNERKLAADIQFFLTVSGEGYSVLEACELLKDKVFDPNFDFGNGSRPLHHAFHFKRDGLVSTLLEAGADPDAENAEHLTPVMMVSADSHEFRELISHAKSLNHTLYCCMREEDSSALSPVLKHLQGNLAGIDLLDWLKAGKQYPKNLHHALCGLDEAGYAKAKELIKADGDRELSQALVYAEEFKRTGKPVKALADLDRDKFRASLMHGFFGGCCGFRGLNLAVLAALDEQEKEETREAEAGKPGMSPE